MFQINSEETITIVCEGGWKYHGTLQDTFFSLFRKPEWIKLKTSRGIILINTFSIVSILYDSNKTNRKTN